MATTPAYWGPTPGPLYRHRSSRAHSVLSAGAGLLEGPSIFPRSEPGSTCARRARAAIVVPRGVRRARAQRRTSRPPVRRVPLVRIARVRRLRGRPSPSPPRLPASGVVGASPPRAPHRLPRHDLARRGPRSSSPSRLRSRARSAATSPPGASAAPWPSSSRSCRRGSRPTSRHVSSGGSSASWLPGSRPVHVAGAPARPLPGRRRAVLREAAAALGLARLRTLSPSVLGGRRHARHSRRSPPPARRAASPASVRSSPRSSRPAACSGWSSSSPTPSAHPPPIRPPRSTPRCCHDRVGDVGRERACCCPPRPPPSSQSMHSTGRGDADTKALDQWPAAAVIPAQRGAWRRCLGATFPAASSLLRRVQLAHDADAVALDTACDRVRWAQAALAGARAMLRAHYNLLSPRSATRPLLGSGLPSRCSWRRRRRSSTRTGWCSRPCRCGGRTRSGTGATALQAFFGALIGFGVAVARDGDDRRRRRLVLWDLLPFVVFLAVYTPGAVNFVVGQAGVTVFVVVLFNILVPDGWRTGLVRMHDVAIGAGISVVVGALLWPRGARGVARRAFADLLRAGADHVRLALGATLDGRAARRGGPGRGQRRRRAPIAPSPRWRTSRSSTVAGRSTGRRGARCCLDAGLLRLAGDGITRSGAWYPLHRVAVDRPGPRYAEEGRTVCTQIDQDADLVERTGVAREQQPRGRRLPARAAESGRLPRDPRVRRPRRRGRSRLGARVAGAGDRAYHAE